MRVGLRITISVALLAWLASEVTWHNVPLLTTSADIVWLVSAVVAVTLSRLIMPAKWRLLLTSQGTSISYWKVLGIYYAANFVGQILPATIGTDFMRFHYTTIIGAPRMVVGASILVERFLGLVGILAVTGIGISVLLLDYSIVSEELSLLLVLTVIASATAVVFLAFSNADSAILRARHWGTRKRRHRFLGILANFAARLSEACLAYLRVPRTLWVFFGLTLSECAVVIIARYCVVVAFVPDMSAIYVLAFAPVVILLHRLPISFAGWGVYEAGFVYFLTQVGVDLSLALLIGVVDHLILLITVLPGAAFYLTNYRGDAIGRPNASS